MDHWSPRARYRPVALGSLAMFHDYGNFVAMDLDVPANPHRMRYALAGFSAGLTCYAGTTRINYLRK